MFTFLYIINLLFISPLVFGLWMLIITMISTNETTSVELYPAKSFYKKLWLAGLASFFVFLISLGLTQFIILDIVGFNFDEEFDPDDYTLEAGDYYSIDSRNESNISEFDSDIAIATIGSALLATFFSRLTYKYLRTKLRKSYASRA